MLQISGETGTIGYAPSVVIRHLPGSKQTAKFTDSGFGVPRVQLLTLRKNSSVSWEAGSVSGSWEEYLVSSALDRQGFAGDVLEAWEAARPQLGRSAQYSFGGLYGVVIRIPDKVAEEIVSTVTSHFQQAMRYATARWREERGFIRN